MPKKTLKKARVQTLAALDGLRGRELVLELPSLGALNPGMAHLTREAESETMSDGSEGSVLGGNTAGLWFVLADDGSIHLVDDCERDLGQRIFDGVQSFAKELTRQNPKGPSAKVASAAKRKAPASRAQRPPAAPKRRK